MRWSEQFIFMSAMPERCNLSWSNAFLRQKQKLFKLVEFPSKVLFKPNKHYVAELEKKDYLGKAKVMFSLMFASVTAGIIHV